MFGVTQRAVSISIHAAQEGCDQAQWSAQAVTRLFQSTQPKRAATWRDTVNDFALKISIHAAQEGCD